MPFQHALAPLATARGGASKRPDSAPNVNPPQTRSPPTPAGAARAARIPRQYTLGASNRANGQTHAAKKDAVLQAAVSDVQRVASPEAASLELGMSPALPLGGSRFKLRVEPQKRTLGDFLLQLLRQRVKKARRLQKTAQATDTRDAANDDDAVRELRLVLRRLRNTLTVASLALELPPEAEADQLSKTLRKLGAPRDTEAVAATLRLAAGLPASAAETGVPPQTSGSSSTTLSAHERTALDALLADLDEARAKGFEEAVECLGNPRVRRVLAALRAFEDRPVVLPFGGRDDSDAAARALARAAGQLFCHPGWELFDLHAGGSGSSAWEGLLGVTASRCEQIHSLRKAIREMRYAMEALQPLYEGLDANATRHYQAQVDTLVELQTHIGTMHDIQVCVQVLASKAHKHEHEHEQAKIVFPQITASLRSRFDDAWVAFQKGREKLISRAGQQHFYSALLGGV